MKKKETKAFTLIEAMVVMMLLIMFLLIVFQFITAIQRSRETQEDKASQQIEAQRAMRGITARLKHASTSWLGAYNVSILDNGKKIEFYQPMFTNNKITKLTKISIYRDTSKDVLMMAVGADSAIPIGADISDVNFSCGCTGCVQVNSSCPVVDVSVTATALNDYTITTKTILRNDGVGVDSSIEITEPQGSGGTPDT